MEPWAQQSYPAKHKNKLVIKTFLLTNSIKTCLDGFSFLVIIGIEKLIYSFG